MNSLSGGLWLPLFYIKGGSVSLKKKKKKSKKGVDKWDLVW